MQVGLQDDPYVLVGAAELVEGVDRALRVFGAFHVDAHEAADLAGGVEDAGGQLQAEVLRDVEPHHGELDRHVALDLGRDQAKQVAVGLRAAAGGVAVEDVLPEQVEGGVDPARMEPAADGDRILLRLPGHEAAGQDRGGGDHRARPRRRFSS